jgi:hypothetical protein
MTVAHDAQVARLGLEIGISSEETSDFRLDCLFGPPNGTNCNHSSFDSVTNNLSSAGSMIATSEALHCLHSILYFSNPQLSIKGVRLKIICRASHLGHLTQ